ELLDILLRDAQVPLAEIRKYPLGKAFELPHQRVEPASASGGRFEVYPPDVAKELASVAAEGAGPGLGVHSHLLVCRRMREVSNTMRDMPSVRHRRKFNPAYLCAKDLAAMGLAEGDQVEIVSDHGRIPAIVAVDDTLRSGVVSMTHGWGG